MLVLPSWEIQLGLPPGELAHCPEEFSQRPAVDPPRITLPARNPRVTPPRNPQALLQKQRQAKRRPSNPRPDCSYGHSITLGFLLSPSASSKKLGQTCPEEQVHRISWTFACVKPLFVFKGGLIDPASSQPVRPVLVQGRQTPFQHKTAFKGPVSAGFFIGPAIVSPLEPQVPLRSVAWLQKETYILGAQSLYTQEAFSKNTT